MATPDEDFPAAHSMDTTWFAVDAKGRLGVFDTGEGGAAPMDAQPGGMWSEAFAHLPLDAHGCRATPVNGGPLAALCPPEKLWEYFVLHRDFDCGKPLTYDKPVTEPIALLCADLPAAAKAVINAEEHPCGLPPLRFAGLDPLLFLDLCELTVLERLIAEGAVIAVSPPADKMPRAANGYEDDRWHLPYIGLYRFDCKEQLALPFEKTATPQLPFTPKGGAAADPNFANLPEVDFDAVAAIQPIPMTPCVAWDGTWWDVSGAPHNLGEESGYLTSQMRPPGDPERLRLALRPEGTPPPIYGFDALFKDD